MKYRLKRGELSMAAARSVLGSYAKLLDYELVKSQSRTKDLKRKKTAVEDALKRFDEIEREKKDIAGNVMKFID